MRARHRRSSRGAPELGAPLHLHVDADFDSSSIATINGPDDPSELALRDDNAAPVRHWFCYRIEGAAGQALCMRIGNAGQSSFAGGWEDGYRACASYDGETWFRVPSSYQDGVLTIEHRPDRDTVGYACFAPYPYARHQWLLHQAELSPRVRLETLAASVEGRPVTALLLGDPSARRVWMIARQHPGETMAEWFVEGVIARLLDEEDPVAHALLERASLVVVPNMNPDGSIRGNHRTNAFGCDINRVWMEPCPERSPEVYYVRRAMLDSGVDLFVDVHGEEAIPYVFGVGAEGIPGYSERLWELEEQFKTHLASIDPDFQVEHGYDRDEPGEADLRVAGNWAAEQFDCLSMTIEMPFRDNEDRPDDSRGWSPERSRGLGRNTLEAILAVLPEVR